ncbi:MAG: molybdenum cofactor guanylyltransferase [Chloroflexi bacterium]|nr:molybdenum cofactor guanylyltransferase [Chloroflexota bacterium]
MSLTTVILAGGRGSRLGGIDKASLEIGGRTVLDHVLDVVAPLSDELLAVVNDTRLDGSPHLRTVRDPDPHAGVLPALLAALDAARSPLCLLVACDMPFLQPDLLVELIRLGQSVDVVMPRIEGQAQPMHAVYRREPCRQAIATALARGDRRMISFLDDVAVRYVDDDELRQVDPALRSFFNVNTPADLDDARRLVEEGPLR